jgi:hypothetical protein
MNCAPSVTLLIQARSTSALCYLKVSHVEMKWPWEIEGTTWRSPGRLGVRSVEQFGRISSKAEPEGTETFGTGLIRPPRHKGHADAFRIVAFVSLPLHTFFERDTLFLQRMTNESKQFVARTIYHHRQQTSRRVVLLVYSEGNAFELFDTRDADDNYFAGDRKFILEKRRKLNQELIEDDFQRDELRGENDFQQFI